VNLESNADEGDVTVLCRRCAVEGWLLHLGEIGWVVICYAPLFVDVRAGAEEE